MKGEKRRPRTRGPRRGMGLRVRGGRGGRPSVMKEVVKGITIRDISELPAGQGLETALHPKRIRMRHPSNVRPSVASPPSPAPQSSPATCSVPSPAMFVKIKGSDLGPSPSPDSPMKHPSSPSPAAPMPFPPGPPASQMQHSSATSRPRNLRDEYIDYHINYGSEEELDSDDEEGVAFSGIPRVFRSLLETPLDQDEDVAADPVSTADPTPNGDPAPAGESAPDVPPAATYQPRCWYDFEWKAFPESQILPKTRRETFSQKNVGPTTSCVRDPYDIFIDVWDRKIMKHIVSETNKYAQQVTAQMMHNHDLHPRSRISRWRDTTVDELYTYFGIVLAMGVVIKTRMEDYWASATDIFQTPGFSAHMSYDRFVLLNKCIHFNDNKDMGAVKRTFAEAKLFKIQPILTHLNKKFQELYTPAQNISLDESLLMWKGWLEMSQLIPNKVARRGIKTYEVCESQTGYLWRFEVHVAKKTPPQPSEDPLDAPVPSIVLRLIKGLEYKGYTLWMDSFYNSPCLARRLKSLGFDCVGTLRTDRKFVPQVLHSLTKQNMLSGQITGLTSGDVDVMVWKDANRVSMISTYHGNGQQTVRGSTKPILISDYNIMMGGVDKKDQLLAMYPVERKRTRIWYKKFFRRLLNISVLNSYIIHHHSSSLNHRDFRNQLIKSLLSKHCTPSLPPPAPTRDQCVDVTHRLAEFPMRNHQRLRRACTSCKNLVRTFCVGCNKTVCMDPCFVTIHS